MKFTDIAFAVYRQYGKARALAAINWRVYRWGRGPARYIGA